MDRNTEIDRIDEIMSHIMPIVTAELATRVKQYLKDVISGGVQADTQIIKMTKESLADLLDDIRGSIETDIDLAQANLETEIENHTFVYDVLYPDADGYPPEEYSYSPAGVWDGDTEEAVIEKMKEVGTGCTSCGELEPTKIKDIPDGPQEISLDYDWDDITCK